MPQRCISDQTGSVTCCSTHPAARPQVLKNLHSSLKARRHPPSRNHLSRSHTTASPLLTSRRKSQRKLWSPRAQQLTRALREPRWSTPRARMAVCLCMTAASAPLSTTTSHRQLSTSPRQQSWHLVGNPWLLSTRHPTHHQSRRAKQCTNRATAPPMSTNGPTLLALPPMEGACSSPFSTDGCHNLSYAAQHSSGTCSLSLFAVTVLSSSDS